MLSLAPDSLSKHQHTNPPFGRYEGLIIDTDISSWQTGFFDRRLKRKVWIYTGIYNEEIALGFAIADTGYLGKSFIYLYHFPTKTFIEEAAEFPFYFDKHFMPSLSGGWFFRSGKKIWQVNRNGNDLECHFEGKKIHADFTLMNFRNGMSAVAPAGVRPFNFTYKNACIGVQAYLKFNNKEIELNGNYGVLDFTLGFPPRDTRWNWASATGKTNDGKIVGLNLVAHFNDGLENVLMFNGKLIPLGKATFNYNHPADKETWNIKTDDGIIDMNFMPSGARKDNINVGILKHQFIQPFGKFEGNILLDGNKIPFTAYGVVEEHHSIW
jgi:uncharacterized protein (DUF3820 family)